MTNNAACIMWAERQAAIPSTGGNANNTGNAGVFYLNSNNSSSNRNANYGSQLSLHKKRPLPLASPLGEI